MDHQIDDEEILDLFRRDVIRVRTDTDGRVTVSKYHNSHGRFRELTPSQHPLSGRWRYKIYLGTTRQRLIYRNKLVWMWKHRRVKDEGCDIDHKDQDNQNDAPDNLRSLPADENRRRTNLEICLEFFDAMARQRDKETVPW